LVEVVEVEVDVEVDVEAVGEVEVDGDGVIGTSATRASGSPARRAAARVTGRDGDMPRAANTPTPTPTTRARTADLAVHRF
jgi:hypothetical protein